MTRNVHCCPIADCIGPGIESLLAATVNFLWIFLSIRRYLLKLDEFVSFIGSLNTLGACVLRLRGYVATWVLLVLECE